MRIAMVIQSFAPVVGGAQRQLESLAPLLEARGVESICVTRLQGPSPVRERRPGIEVRRVRVPASIAGASLVYTAGGLASVARFHPDVIHTYDLQSPSTIGLLASTMLRKPVVAKVLSTGRYGDVRSLLRRPLGRRRLRAIARRFSGFISLSPEVDAELAEHGVATERIWRIPNGVNTERYRPPERGERERIRADLGLPRDEPLTLYCGRYTTDSKRLDVLLESFATIPGRLLLVGEGGARDLLRTLADAPELRGRVEIRDAVDDTAPIYRAADLYISASTTEGMSGSVLEAMATGLPVAASPASGMAELVRPDTGVMAEDPSADALGQAARALLADPARRARAGATARDLATSRYSLESTADRMVELYRSVMVGANGHRR
jgi:glycosyltransferase involved in cell wall biosynthesis